MDQDNCSEVVYIFVDRGELIAALERYQTRYEATHTLPERAESLHTPDMVRDRDIPFPLSYAFRPL